MNREVCEMAKRVKCMLPQWEDLSLVPNANIDVMWAADTWNSSAACGRDRKVPGACWPV